MEMNANTITTESRAVVAVLDSTTFSEEMRGGGGYGYSETPKCG